LTVATLPAAAIPIFLVGTGVAAFLAVSVIGRLADRYPRAALLAAVTAVAASSPVSPTSTPMEVADVR
jgi:predicted MFS family arabinose efflux permease